MAPREIHSVGIARRINSDVELSHILCILNEGGRTGLHNASDEIHLLLVPPEEDRLVLQVLPPENLCKTWCGRSQEGEWRMCGNRCIIRLLITLVHI